MAPPTRGGSQSVMLLWAPVAIGLWLGVAFVCIGLVLFGLEPLFQQRNQQARLEAYRTSISHAANEAQGLPGVTAPTKAPAIGASVGVLEIPRLHLRQVVIAGSGSAQTQDGPGQVPGTAGPGQPGNTAIVGRRLTFGGPFGDLDRLRPGDAILISTVQGQSVYKVHALLVQVGSVSDLSRRTRDNRLTLFTTANRAPWNTTAAAVVVARLEGRPFPPTPQLERAGHPTGASGDSGAWVTAGLLLVGYVLAVVAAIVVYRRSSVRVAYLLTAAPLVVLTVLAAETVSRLLPAWF